MDELQEEIFIILCQLEIFFPATLFWNHGAFDCSSCKRNQFMQASLSMMDVPNGAICEDFERIWEESILAISYWVLFGVHVKKYIGTPVEERKSP